MIMKRKINTRERLEKLIGKVILLLVQSAVFGAIMYGCFWLLGMVVNLMQHDLIVTIGIILIDFMLIMKETLKANV